MATAFMAYPELRDPFEESPVHPEGSTTVLYQGRTVRLDQTGSGDGLLIDPDELSAVNGFELKPEGACYEGLCIPVADDLFIEADGRRWFNLEAFAEHIGQPFVADREARVWSFAEMPARRDNVMLNAMAPDISVTDRAGNVVHLADLKGKKALIVTWSSW